MQCYLITLSLVLSFVSSYAMRSNQELQRLIDRQRYPLDIQQQDLFDQACAKTQNGMFDDDSLSTMLALATNHDNPYLPAIQQLAKKAILEKDPQALDLTLKGAMFGDERCMFSHASLLTNPEFVHENSCIDDVQRELLAHQLLFTVKNTMQPTITVKNNKFEIDNTLVATAEQYYKDHTDKLCQLYHQKLDNLAQHDPEQLEQIKNEAIATASVPAGCYFINKNADNNDYQSLEQVTDWAELIACRPEFYAFYGSNKSALTYLKQSGALKALERVAHQSDYPELQQRACMIMGTLGINELESEKFDVSRARIIRARATKKYLEKAAESNPEALLMLLAFDDQEQVFDVCDRLIEGLPVLSRQRANLAIDQIIKKLSYMPQEKKSEAKIVKSKLFASDCIAEYKKNLSGWQLYSLALEMVDAECIEHAAPTFADAYAKGHIRAGCKLLALTNIDQKKIIGFLDDLFTKTDALDMVAQNELADDMQLAMKNVALHATDLAIHERVVGRLKDHRASFTAFNDLYKNGKRKNDQYRQMAHRYMQHALTTPNILFKKQLIEYCMDHDDLLLLATQALPELCNDKSNENDENTVLLFNRALKTLIKKADEGDADQEESSSAAMAAHAFLTNMPERYFVNAISEPKKLGEFYLDQAARQGYLPAINALKDSTTYNVIPFNGQAFLKAATFFSQAINICKPEEKELKKVLSQKLMTQCVLVMGINTQNADERIKTDFANPDLFYHFTMGLGEWDERVAYMAFLKAEENASKKNNFELFERIGCADYLKKLEQQGKGWASYARAITIFNRLPLNEKLEWRKPAERLKMVKEVQELIQKAKNAPFPYSGNKIALGELDLINGSQLEIMAGELKNKDIMAKAITYFEQSALKKFPAGLQKFGILNLLGTVGKGQQFALRALENLIEATTLGYKPSHNVLQDIYQQGFGYKFGCGGYVTNEMRSMINKALIAVEKTNPKENNSAQEAADKENNAIQMQANVSLYEQAIKNLESGNFALAYNQFRQEAARVNVGAIAYLGIMQRDGLGSEQSLQAAKRSFITALLQWDHRHIQYYTILQNAAMCLEELFGEDLNARIAIAKFAIGCVRFKELSKSLQQMFPQMVFLTTGSQDLNRHESTIENIFSKINDAEIIAFKSKSDEEKNLFFSSGLADAINDFCDADNDAQILSTALLITRYRLLELGKPKNNKDYETLVFAQKKLMGLLVNTVKGIKDCTVTQVAAETIKILDSTVELAEVDPEFNGVLGMLHVMGSLQEMPWADLNHGIQLLEIAAKNGSEEAGLALAHLHLYTVKLSPRFEKNKGKAILEKLAGDYHNHGAMIELAEALIEDDKFKEAEEYLRRAILIDPADRKSLYLLGHALLYNADTSKNYREICNFLELAGKDETFTQSTRLIQAYLGLSHPESFQENDPLRSEQRLLDYLDRSLLSCMVKNRVTNAALTSLCLSDKFLDELKKWSQKIEKRYKASHNELDKNILARTYNVIASANLIMGRTLAESGVVRESYDDDSLEYFNKTKGLAVQKKSFFMTAIEVIIDTAKSALDKKKLNCVLKNIKQACEELKKQNRRLKECTELLMAIGEAKAIVKLLSQEEANEELKQNPRLKERIELLTAVGDAKEIVKLLSKEKARKDKVEQFIQGLDNLLDNY